MHMPEIQSVLNEKNISFSYVEEDNCGSIDFEHRGLRYAGRDEEIEGDYDTILAEHLKKEF